MKRKPRMIVRAARQLVDAEPVFVSHVRHGANQTPFKSVKADDADADNPVAAASRVKEEPMTTKTAGKTAAAKKVKVQQAAPAQAAGKPEIASIFFPIEKFPTEAAVKDYLTSKAYAVGDIAIEADTLGFIARGHEDDQFDGDLKEIDFKEDGIVLSVGYLKAEAASKLATKGEGDEPAQGAQGGEGAGAEGAQGNGEGAGADEQSAADAGSEGGAGGGEGGGDNANDTPAEAAAPAAADEGAGEPAAVADAVTEEVLENGDKNPDLNTGVQTNAKTATADLPAIADAVTAFDAALTTAKAALATVETLEVSENGTAKKFESISDVLSYMDDVPPGFYDVVHAYGILCRSALRDNDYARIASGGAELADYITSMAKLFASKETAEKGLDPDAPQANEEEAEADELGAALVDHILRGLSGKPARVTPQAPAPVAVAAPAPATKTAADQGAGTAADEPNDPIMTMLKGIAGRLDGMEQRIEQVAAAPAATKGSTVKAATPARKGQGDVDASDEQDERQSSRKYIDDVPDDNLHRNVFGLPRANARRGFGG